MVAQSSNEFVAKGGCKSRVIDLDKSGGDQLNFDEGQAEGDEFLPMMDCRISLDTLEPEQGFNSMALSAETVVQLDFDAVDQGVLILVIRD